MSEFTWSPDYGLSLEAKQHTIKVAFGDGYDLRISSSINNTVRTFNPSFTDNGDVIDEIDTFLDDLEGVDYFTWTPPDGIPGKFICAEWDRAVVNFGQHKLSASFIEVFEA